MGATLNMGSFQITALLETIQVVEPPGNVPGLENPQISSASVRALKGNGGIIYLGGSTVSASTGFELAAGDVLNLDSMGLAKLSMFATKAGDKLCVFWTGP